VRVNRPVHLTFLTYLFVLATQKKVAYLGFQRLDHPP